LEALAITSVALSPLDPDILYAGTGSFSSFAESGGAAIGVLKYTDIPGGGSWSILGQDKLAGLRITSVVPTSLDSGQVLMASTVDALAKAR
jgi:hypothetical protein